MLGDLGTWRGSQKGFLPAHCPDKSCNKVHRVKICLPNCQPGSCSQETCQCAEAALNLTGYGIKEDDIQQ